MLQSKRYIGFGSTGLFFYHYCVHEELRHKADDVSFLKLNRESVSEPGVKPWDSQVGCLVVQILTVTGNTACTCSL